jgi:hypothetical protein
VCLGARMPKQWFWLGEVYAACLRLFNREAVGTGYERQGSAVKDRDRL